MAILESAQEANASQCQYNIYRSTTYYILSMSLSICAIKMMTQFDNI